MSPRLTELEAALVAPGPLRRDKPPLAEESRQSHREQRFVRALPLLVTLLSALIGSTLIVATYGIFDQTYDEAAHLACGMEWLDHGTYTLEALHPPLARVAAAILPYLGGARSQGLPSSLWAGGNAILEQGGHYHRTLTLARLGILPFFWLTCFLVWRFMARDFGDWHAAIAVLFVAFCPLVLAHSAVAATDAPLMAMFLASLLALRELLDSSRWTTAIVAGVVIALACLTKFTALPFLACSGGILLLHSWVSKKRFPLSAKALLLAAICFAFTIWAGYRFSHGPIVVQSELSREQQEKFAALPSWEKDALLFPDTPAAGFFRGIKAAHYQGTIGRRASYLLGQVYDGGRWYFFPVAILVKTQIPMLLLSAAGAAWLLFRRDERRQMRTIFLLAGLIGPLAVGMAGSVNIGLRHILPIYPFLAMLAAVGAVELWRLSIRSSRAAAMKAALVLLLAWNIFSCLRAAPDFLAYFNEAAAPYAGSILVESDLDWGQDLKRLSATLNQLHAQSVTISYFGAADLSQRLIQTSYLLKANDRPAGWVAISEARLRKQPAAYGWLLQYPYTRVGTSIRLYHFATAPNS